MSYRRTAVAAVGAAGLAAGLLISPIQQAVAGHTNPILEASLDGKQEVGVKDNGKPAKHLGDHDGRGEAYVFGIDNDPGRTTLCYVLTVEKIAELDQAPLAGVRMAHIHRGAPGENGPVVANLAWPLDGESADCLREGDTRGGNPVYVNGGSAAEILSNPEGFYVNVHNSEYPAGAVRGQLAST